MQKETEQMKELARILVSQKSVLNVTDLSTYTGLSKSAIYKLTHLRKIRFSRPNGKVIFFLRSDVDEYLMSNPIQPEDDIYQESINFVNGKSSGGQMVWR